MKKLRGIWQKLTIRKKISLFTISVFVALSVALLIDVWIVKVFMIDFNNIMVNNSRGGEIVTALNREIDAFDGLIHDTDSMDPETFEVSVATTKSAIYAVPLSYASLGDDRYAQLQALRTAYEIYAESRNRVIEAHMADSLHVEELYDVYSMQSYLSGYARKFADTTTQQGNLRYRALFPVVLKVPFIAAAISLVLFLFILKISRILNGSVTVPVIKLANASRKIAANDFFVDDVVVTNKDELGDMVSAFNKMKYATGEYIKAMEERREALDQLHEQEMENLRIEKQLDTMNLELLKSQINPHFLFNTLNVIAGNANLEGAETTEQMIEALSSLFRYNLKNHSKEALLSQELKISRDYMYLQKMRFGSRVEFEIDSDVDENKVVVPTFTFQPLLENAIIHGISSKVEGGKISVSIRDEGGMLQIKVADTGVGIDEETLESIRRHLQSAEKALADAGAKPVGVGVGVAVGAEPVGGVVAGDDEDTVGIGLGNINKRIRAMYEGAALDIFSRENEGTTVTITIPLLGVEEQ
ncbi:sensor histidine kinase [Butyrivibrio sp. WCD2001]|uniref:sensor histidine kinase n=1 Tax=Butyrivibrio sp. WCD2001 TaxID=1280681 RepID=UPI0004010768|nr:sensor histidine kinase [Butyrivibrio sp. WCD2001]